MVGRGDGQYCPPSEGGEVGWDWEGILVSFIAAGYSEDLFWSLTPRQIARHLKASARRARIEHNNRMEQAHITATIPLMKKVPKLEKLMVPLEAQKPKARQTAEQMIAMARRWNAAVNARQ